jgi:hypothetical protein
MAGFKSFANADITIAGMVELETDPALRKFLGTTKAQLDARHAKVGALLNRRYFTQ